MEKLFASGHIVDFLILLVVLEALAVVGWRFLKGSGPAPLPFIVNLLAGTFLMAALRNALAGVSWIWIAICLIGALTAHVMDLIWRWQSADAHVLAGLRQSKTGVSRHTI